MARPVAAFLTAFTAGFAENFFNRPTHRALESLGNPCPVDNCCNGINCSAEEHRNHHTLLEKIRAGLSYAAGELWGELAGWFFIGILLAGLITTMVPDDLIGSYLGGGLSSMLLMLVVGIPLYICATASTPVAAAFIMKGLSPGTALVFLLVGPATNITSLSVLIGLLGRRACALYLAAIATISVFCGLFLDFIYLKAGISASAVVGQAAEIMPFPVRLAATLFLLAISIPPLWRSLRAITDRITGKGHSGCGCSSGSCATPAPSAAPLNMYHGHNHHGCDENCHDK